MTFAINRIAERLREELKTKSLKDLVYEPDGKCSGQWDEENEADHNCSFSNLACVRTLISYITFFDCFSGDFFKTIIEDFPRESKLKKWLPWRLKSDDVLEEILNNCLYEYETADHEILFNELVELFLENPTNGTVA